MSTMVTSDDVRRYDVVILGGGYAGLMAAFRLGRKRQTLRIALINGSDQFLERVRLQESIVSEVERRIPSISMLLAGTRVEFICGLVASLDPNRRRVGIVLDGREQEIAFNEAIYALGTRTDVESVPGVAEHAYRLERRGATFSSSAPRQVERERQSADSRNHGRRQRDLGRGRRRNQDRMAEHRSDHGEFVPLR
jgi:NADH:ubiquinone reductase (H+-translocating)